MEYKHSLHHVYLLNYHIIWCPKRRKPVLVGKIKDRLIEILQSVAVEKGIDIIALEVMPNHLHIFISAYPCIAIHKIIKAFKGRSSNLLRKEFKSLLKLPALWTHSYFISTAGNISSATVKKYIEMQSKV